MRKRKRKEEIEPQFFFLGVFTFLISIKHFRKQFAYLEDSGRSGPVIIPLERRHFSPPRGLQFTLAPSLPMLKRLQLPMRVGRLWKSSKNKAPSGNGLTSTNSSRGFTASPKSTIRTNSINPEKSERDCSQVKPEVSQCNMAVKSASSAMCMDTNTNPYYQLQGEIDQLNKRISIDAKRLQISDAIRILWEVKLLRLLQHPDIVEIKHIMLPSSKREFKDIFVVFELMESDLHQVIKANDHLTREPHQFFLY